MNNLGTGVGRAISVILFFSLAAIALANGAMGLALEIFPFGIWIVYVIATIILEAWMIGVYLGRSWWESITWSLAFNSITAFCCAGGIFAPFLHQMVVDGNPFLWTVEILSIYGLISAIVEGVMWRFALRATTPSKVERRAVLAHVCGIPLALVILLIPDRA